MMDRKKLIQLVDTTELQFELQGSQCSILWAGNGIVFYPDDTEDGAIEFRDSADLVDNLIINGKQIYRDKEIIEIGMSLFHLKNAHSPR